MSGAVADPCTPDKAVPSGRTPDDRWPADRAVPCYWPYHKPLYDLGVDGMWPDQGDGLDEPSRLARIRMYWEGPQQYRPNERPFALHRNGSPGMQRYGAFLWSGDVYSFWETLKTHVPVAINTGLSGIPFWGTDIGGFVPTPDYTGELHVRWFQFGTFCPSFRSHGRNWHLRLPWGWNMGEDRAVGTARLHRRRGRSRSEGAEQPAGRADREEVSRAALPAAALHLHDRARVLRHRPADDARAVAASSRRCATRSRAAISSCGAATSSCRRSSRRARRRAASICRAAAGSISGPSRALDGGREIDRAVDLETMPLHVRAGAIIPLGPVKQYTDEPVDAPLDAHRLSRRRRRVHALRRRWQDVRAQARRLHAAGDDVERRGAAIHAGARSRLAHASAGASAGSTCASPRARRRNASRSTESRSTSFFDDTLIGSHDHRRRRTSAGSGVSDLRRDADLRRLRDFVRRLSSAGGIDAADADSLLRLCGLQHVLEVRDEAVSGSDPADPEIQLTESLRPDWCARCDVADAQRQLPDRGGGDDRASS